MKNGSIYSAVVLGLAMLVGCNSKFEIDFTPDNHYLKEQPVPVVDYAATTHPVVLVHGAYGFVDIFGLEYWYDIPEILEMNGATVYVARVAGAHTAEVRGEQLITQLEGWGGGRYHLMGHSLGAPTIRYVAATRPDLVASVTSIAGANFGSAAADADNNLDIPLVAPIVAFMGNALGHVIDVVTQESFEQNVLALSNAMTKEGSDAFNADYPEGLPALNASNESAACEASLPTVGYSDGTSNPDYVETSPSADPTADFAAYYANATGAANTNLDGTFAAPPVAPVGVYEDINYLGSDYRVFYYSWGGNVAGTNTTDPLDKMHTSMSEMIPGADDDGFLERCSSHLGYVVKDNYKMNHLDFINWFLAYRSSDAPYPPVMYLVHLNHLKSRGL